MIKKQLLLALLILFAGTEARALTQPELEQALYRLADKANGKGGFMEFYIGEVQFFMVVDADANRMRIISPVADYQDLSEDQHEILLESNFHDALDARYALSNGVIYAAYIHPLAELTLEQLLSGVYQVASLSVTFGREYSSGVMHFGDM